MCIALNTAVDIVQMIQLSVTRMMTAGRGLGIALQRVYQGLRTNLVYSIICISPVLLRSMLPLWLFCFSVQEFFKAANGLA